MAKTQEEKQKEREGKKLTKQSEELKNLVKQIQTSPDLWKNAAVQFLRTFFEYVIGHREQFPRQPGDVSSERKERADRRGDGMIPLTAGFIAKVADADAFCDIEGPVVQIISKEVKQSKGHGADATLKLVKLRVTDGDNNQMSVRLDTNAANYHRRVEEGDVIVLSVYTPFSVQVTEESFKYPMVLVLSFVHLGYRPLPDASVLKPPMCTGDSGGGSSSEAADQGSREADSNIPINLDDAECNEESRLCSLYGVGFDTCICNCIPPEDLSRNLEEIAEDCHFVTKDLSSFENHDKRFVLYWYYATNVYCIRGKGKRKPLPTCLV